MRQPPTLCDLVRMQAAARPGNVAVCHRGRTASYARVAGQSRALASWLRANGIRAGDRVVLLLPNSIEYVVCYLGILEAGGVVVALNPETTGRELSSLLCDAAPSGMAVGPSAMPAVKELACKPDDTGLNGVRYLLHTCHASSLARIFHGRSTSLDTALQEAGAAGPRLPRPEQLAQIIYTSGTTGRPKGVMLTHRNIAANCRSILGYLGLTADDSVLVTLPFFYSYGNSLLFTHLATGGRLVLASDLPFWNRVLDQMQQQRVTGFSGVPASFAMLLHRSDFKRRTFPDLRYVTCAGGGLAPVVVEELRRVLPDVRLYLMYGQTEATARLSTLLPDELDLKPGSIGRGIDGVSLDVLDGRAQPVPPGQVGEVVARGDNLMLGYWRDPEATGEVLRPEGLRTGDLAYKDEEGYIYIVGRRGDMIKTGAYRINPGEIEEVILQLPGIAEAAVVGVPDEFWGESPVAVVVPAERRSTPTEHEILQHCRRQLPRYKTIREVRFAEDLPRTSSGKVRRAELRETIRAAPATRTD